MAHPPANNEDALEPAPDGNLSVCIGAGQAGPGFHVSLMVHLGPIAALKYVVGFAETSLYVSSAVFKMKGNVASVVNQGSSRAHGQLRVENRGQFLVINLN